jgi:rod shape-determining protein MreD
LIADIRLLFPMALAIILLIISTIPIHLVGISAFFPIVDVMVIYYWSNYRSSLLPNWFIFLLGILRDLIEGISLGVSPFSYLVVRLVVMSGKDAHKKESFIFIWQGFAVVAFIAIILKWLLVSFSINTPLILNSAIMQFMISIAIYPVFHWVFNLVNKAIPKNFQNV